MKEKSATVPSSLTIIRQTTAQPTGGHPADGNRTDTHPTDGYSTDAHLTRGSETFATLLHLAHGKTLSIPPEIVVEHVLAVTPEADWPVRRAALEAIIRRCKFASQDGLQVATRPPGRGPFGIYTTRRPRQAPRTYATLLEGVRPLRGSCDCPDFLRGSLGVCKHLLTVLDAITSRPRKLAGILAAEEKLREPEESRRQLGAGKPRLIWDPVRPLTGPGDWLDRVRWIDVGGHARGGRVRDGRRSLPAGVLRARRWFHADGDGEKVLRDAFPDRPVRRAALVQDLVRLVPRNGRRGQGPARSGDPALRALLISEQQRLARVLRDLQDIGALMRSLRTLKHKLYGYQLEAVERLFRTGRLLLADDMGLGKTIQAIAACHALWHTGKVKRGLLIVPASLKSQWLREWEIFTDAPATVVDGNQQQRREIFERCRRGFLIANYEQVLRDLQHMHAWQPGFIVLDEAQRIKNWATKTAAYVKNLQPPYRLVLTGTPMENRLDELASIMDWVDDLALEPKWRLAPLHSIRADGAREVSGARHLDTLRARLAPCMVRRLRKDILRQLPSRTDTVVPVELTDEQRGEHDALNQPIARLLAMAQRRPLSQPEFLRLMSLLTTQRMIANGLAQVDFAQVWPRIADGGRGGGRRGGQPGGQPGPDANLINSLNSPKLLELREIIAQIALQQQRKIVVFSQWRRMLALAHWVVQDLLAAQGVRAAFFTGKERQKQRTKNIVDFHDDPATRVLFATDAGGVGLNLQRAATCCINIEMPWNPAVLEQRIGRIYRMGQKDPIDVYNLVSQDCIESRIAGLVADKRALFTGLFDGSSDQIRFERSGSFLSSLEKIVVPVSAPELAEVEDGAGEADPVVDAEVEAMIAAADESEDPASVVVGEVAVDQGAAPGLVAAGMVPATGLVPAGLPAAGEAPATGSATTAGAAVATCLPAAGSAGGRAATDAGPILPSAGRVGELFAQLAVVPTADGGIRIDAPPEAAASLAAVFEGLAGLLRQAGQDKQ